MAARIRARVLPHAYIREHREDKNLTQEELAGRLGQEGVHKGTVSRWETGKRKVDLDVLGAICEALGISLNEVFELPKPSLAPPVPPLDPKPSREERKLGAEIAAILARKRAS